MGEVRPQSARHTPQRRGWTPQTLADALQRRGLPGSSATIKRACADGEIPHTRTAGGHIRLDAAWVARMYPALSQLPVAATGERHAVASLARTSDARDRTPVVETRRAPFPSASR